MHIKDNYQVLDDLEKNLNLIDHNMREWNKEYFKTHKARYISDLKIIKHYHSIGNILEIGAVPCHLTYLLQKQGYPIIGLDINPERAWGFIKEHNLNILECDIEKQKIPFADNSFNIIIFNEIIEHLRIDPISSLKEICRVLSPDGIMILTTPNLYSLNKIISFLIGRGFNNPYKEFEKLHTLGHMGHIRLYSTKEVKCFLENTGFKVISIKYNLYKKNEINIISSIIDLFSRIIPRFRPSQMIISKKGF